MPVDTILKSREASHQVYFYNDTGGSVTVTSITSTSGKIRPTASTKKLADAGKKINYKSAWVINLEPAVSSAMFNLFNETVKVNYTTVDGQSHTHEFPAKGLYNYKVTLPYELNVILAVGATGKPRMYRLRKMGSHPVNGMPYYWDASKNLGLYFEINGGYAYWAFITDGATIAHGDMIQANRNCSLEEAYMLFPMDSSYGALINGINYIGKMGRYSIDTSNPSNTLKTKSSQYSMIHLTGEGDVRFMFIRNVSTVGWKNRDANVAHGVKVADIIYRSDRQYFDEPYSVLHSGNTPGSGSKAQRPSFIYEFTALTSDGEESHSASDDKLFEWEILQSDYQSARFVTQLPTFTLDLARLGIDRIGEAAARCRMIRLGHIEPTTKQNKLGAFSSWKLFPQVNIEATAVGSGSTSSTVGGWFKARVTSGDTGPIYQDCGWDTKLQLHAKIGNYIIAYPMIYMDEYVAAGVGGSLQGELPRSGTVNLAVRFHNNSLNITSVNKPNPGVNNYEAPNIWIRDNDAHWGGTGVSSGTYATGYQCCGIAVGNDVYTGRHHNECVIKLELDESSSNSTNRPTFGSW